jgi:nitroreductase
MNLIEAIHARRAVRAYSPRKVSDDAIGSLLAAAVQAPSAMNAQSWGFAVVQDAARLRRYSDLAKRMLLELSPDQKTRRYEQLLRDENFNIFYDASTLIVICATALGPYSDADCWLAAENLMLAACDQGLGTCCIGFAVPVLNTADVKAELQIPAGGAAVAPVIVGYPSAVVPPVARAAPKILSWSR